MVTPQSVKFCFFYKLEMISQGEHFFNVRVYCIILQNIT